MEKYHHRYRYFLIVAILTMVGIMVMLISKDSSVLNVNSVETENELKKEVPAIALLAGDEQPGFFCRFVKEWGNYGTGDGQFTNPYSIALDNQRNVYVAENDLNNIRRIQKFDSDGNFLLKWTSTTDKWEEVNGIVGSDKKGKERKLEVVSANQRILPKHIDEMVKQVTKLEDPLERMTWLSMEEDYEGFFERFKAQGPTLSYRMLNPNGDFIGEDRRSRIIV